MFEKIISFNSDQWSRFCKLAASFPDVDIIEIPPPMIIGPFTRGDIKYVRLMSSESEKQI